MSKPSLAGWQLLASGGELFVATHPHDTPPIQPRDRKPMNLYAIGNLSRDSETGFLGNCCIVLAPSETEAFTILDLQANERPIKKLSLTTPQVIAILPEQHPDM